MNKLPLEIHRLPLIFKYIEISKSRNIGKLNPTVTYFLHCEKYQTKFYTRTKPLKSITRLL